MPSRNLLRAGDATHRPPSLKANERPLFELVLRPEPRVNYERSLRALLKFVLRSHGLRCISIKRLRPPDA